MPMEVSKGVESHDVSRPGVVHIPTAGEDDDVAARVLYAADTRAKQGLGMGGLRIGGGIRLITHAY